MENFEKILHNNECEHLSEQEQEWLKQVSVYEPNIIVLKELVDPKPESVSLMLGHTLKLGNQFDKFGVVIDLTSANRPTAKTRRMLHKKFGLVAKQATHISFLTKGILLHTAIRFVMYGLKHKSYSMNENLEDAVTSIRKAIR